MTISGPDLSNFQAGLIIQPGTAFVIAKATEGLSYQDASFHNFQNQSAHVGAVFSGYHFIHAGNGQAQADYYWNYAGATPCMIDCEPTGSSNPTVTDCLNFITQLHNRGGRVWGTYFPDWYWQRVGGNLAALGPIVASSYDYVGADTGRGWTKYGGVAPTVWQYTDRQPYGGRAVDFNSYKGTVEQFQELVEGTMALSPQDLDAIAERVWAFMNPAAGDTVDMRQALVNAAHSAANAPHDVWAFKSATLDKAFDMRQYLVNAANNVVPPAGNTGGPIA